MKSPFIYVVNIQVPKNLYSEYIQWLKPHISEMTELPHFTSAQVYDCVSLNEEKNTIRVHYHLSSQGALQEYLDGPAKQMRSQLPEKFTNKVSIQREMLQPLAK